MINSKNITMQEVLDIVQHLSWWRETLGFSVEEVCIAVGVTHQTWYNWEGGIAYPKLENIPKLIRFLSWKEQKTKGGKS